MNSVPPLLTLQQLRESGPLGTQLLRAARRHVGEAGLEQAASLERLLVACQQQAAVATALRSLGWALRQAADDVQAGTRDALLGSLQQQVENAESAEDVLAGALRDLTSTPVIFISAAALHDIEARAQQQLADATHLVSSAAEVDAAPRTQATLREVEEEMHSALAQVVAADVDGRAQTLAYLIQEAAARLAALPTLPDPALAELLRDVAEGLQVRAAQ